MDWKSWRQFAFLVFIMLIVTAGCGGETAEQESIYVGGDDAGEDEDQDTGDDDSATTVNDVCSPYLTQNVIKGDECSIQASNAVALIYTYFNDTLSGICTGTFITKDTILTAGHCTELVYDAIHDAIFFGGYYIASVTYPPFDDFFYATTDAPANSEILYVITHPLYGLLQKYGAVDPYDVGLIILNQEADVTPVPLITNTSTIATEVHIVDITQVMGYGLTTSDEGFLDHDGLHPLHGGEMIISEIESPETNHTIVAYPNSDGQLTCSGDSGGPALIDFNGKKAIVGVTSYGDGGCVYDAGFVSPWLIYQMEESYPDDDHKFFQTYAPDATYY